jgi:hypothetical protein
MRLAHSSFCMFLAMSILWTLYGRLQTLVCSANSEYEHFYVVRNSVLDVGRIYQGFAGL